MFGDSRWESSLYGATFKATIEGIYPGGKSMYYIYDQRKLSRDANVQS